jgi:uncharacterized coiled-coil DUF342 family protein
MHTNPTKDLFQLQTELVDMKVNMAVNNAIAQVVNQITELRNELHEFKHEMREDFHELRHEMRDRFSSLENRVTAVETRLGMVSDAHKEIRNRLMDYCFKAGWLILGATVSYFVLQLQLLVK